MGELINLNPQVGIPDEIARDTEVIAAIASHVSASHPFPIFGFGEGVSTEDVFDFGSGFLDCRNGGGTFPPGMGHIQGFQARFAYMGGKWGMQLVAQNNINNECFFRTVNSDNWGPWRRIWNDGNFNPSNYLLQAAGDVRYRRSSVALADSDIPDTIARDSEVTAAITAHASATDPHAQYLLPSEGDARYPQYKKVVLTTGATQGSNTNAVHGLDATKILSFSGIVKIDLSNSAGFVPLVAPGGLIGLPGYNYSIHLDAGNVLCRLHPTDSANILNRQIIVNILYNS